jgi:hypothetical protein
VEAYYGSNREQQNFRPAKIPCEGGQSRVEEILLIVLVSNKRKLIKGGASHRKRYKHRKDARIGDNSKFRSLIGGHRPDPGLDGMVQEHQPDRTKPREGADQAGFAVAPARYSPPFGRDSLNQGDQPNDCEPSWAWSISQAPHREQHESAEAD